jgi:hypothetical protein
MSLEKTGFFESAHHLTSVHLFFVFSVAPTLAATFDSPSLVTFVVFVFITFLFAVISPGSVQMGYIIETVNSSSSTGELLTDN